MRSICLFASYTTGKGLPYYTGVYLEELKKHCTEVVYLHSNDLDPAASSLLETMTIKEMRVPNEGFDFGQWQKAFAVVQWQEYDQLYLINDSCILFAPLDKVFQWFNQSDFDFGGLTESTYGQRHIQSYFLMFRRSTFRDLDSFFSTTTASDSIQQVIRDFEIGLSRFLLARQYTCGAFLDNEGYAGEFAPYYKCVHSHLRQGSPMIKRKILFSSYRKEELFTLARMNFDIRVSTYLKWIHAYNPQLILSLEKTMNEGRNQMGFPARLKYTATRLMIRFYKKIRL